MKNKTSKGTPSAVWVRKMRANMYPGKCVKCGLRVEAHEGQLRRAKKGSHRGWDVEHPCCSQAEKMKLPPVRMIRFKGGQNGKV